MKIKKQTILNKIYDDWGENPQSEICASVLEYLLRTATQAVSHITYGSLKIVIDEHKKHTDVEILKAIQYLCGERTNLLEMNFEFMENEDNIFPLSHSDMKDAQNEGGLVHPETGEIINDFEEKVLVYFKPSDIAKNIIQ